MQHLTIPLSQLHAHPANSNVMPADLFAKLVDHLRRSGQYPPIIARPQPAPGDALGAHDNPDAATSGGCYQILDGHHRVRALRELGITEASCVVWPVDDAQALLLLATLNRLQGRDDPRKRAALLDQLHHLPDFAGQLETLAQRLPEDVAAVEKLLRLTQPPPAPLPPQDLAQMPVAVHFFLLPAQRDQLESRLRTLGGPREQALMQLVANQVTSG